ncbi:MAG: SpoIIE family protein phosphatase [Oscillospiraceae bacterium]|nr:SpoIIE family protein phosphatase [Oscillospiraceae bacterium]
MKITEKIHSIKKFLPEGRDELYRIPAIAAAGLLLSLTSLFGQASPYPIIFLGGLSGFDCLYTLAGAFTGFLLRGGFSGFAENLSLILTMAFVTAFRFFAGMKFPAATAVIAALGYFTSALLLGGGVDFLPNVPVFALVIGFGILAAAKVRTLILSGLPLSELPPSASAALGYTYSLVIAALSSFEFSMLNIGVLTASVFTAVFSYRFKYTGGAVCGALGAFGIITAAPEYAAAGLTICVAGMGCSVFSRKGGYRKHAHMAGYILSIGLVAAFSGIAGYTFAEINSVIAGGLVFLFVPVDFLCRRFKREAVPKSGANVSEIFARRLRLTGEAMGDVQGAIEKTAEILERAGSRDISWVYNTACGEVCRRCRHNMTCWGDEYNDTLRVMGDISSLLKKGKIIKSEHFYGPLAYRCPKREQLSVALNAQYREFTAINTANRKIAQMRTILLSQISATRTMMLGMSGEFGSSSGFDRGLAFTVENILFERGIFEPIAAVSLNEGRMTVEAYGRGKLKCSPDKLCDLLCTAMHREFDLPEIIHSNGEFLMTMFDRAAFAVECGVYQVSRGKEKNCGDYFDSFTDKKGFAYIILSDGMGSGGRARIDSAFACGMLIKLLRAGVDITAAIEIINNSLLVKSADESFATLDICKIDLFSGNVELYKAGSAPTYISCNRRVVKAGGKGLPVGINHRPVYERQTFTIGNRDLIIMASDGAELSERWLEQELRKNEWNKDDMNGFAQTIATAAKYSSAQEREDDISVVAVKLIK